MARLFHAIRRRLPVRTLSSRAAYALWANMYPPYAHNHLMQIEQNALMSLLPPLNDLQILDLACGSGRYALAAAQMGARRVAGLDNSIEMLQHGQRSLALHEPIQAELEALPYNADSFDGVICGLATGHLSPTRMRSAIHEIARVLRPGGWLLLSDFHPFLYLSGGRRTFIAPGGRRFAVEHYPHLVADYFMALIDADLVLDALIEPLAAARHIPAVLVFRARKHE